MKRLTTACAAALVALMPMSDLAEAKDKTKVKIKSKHGHVEYSLKSKRQGADVKIKSKPGSYEVKFKGDCPPGLAKKNPPCVPPGLARQAPVTHDNDHDHDHDHDHDDQAPIVRDHEHSDYNEYHGDGITHITTINGDVIHVGDIIVNPTDRYPVLDPLLFGLPPLPENELYLRVGDAAVRLDADTQRVMTILALADLLVE